MQKMVELIVPKWLVQKYLKVKGWQDAMLFNCSCRGIFADDAEPEHPIRWLWEHINKGHEPKFELCHCWDRKNGGGTVGIDAELEEWHRWIVVHWNKKTQMFDRYIDYVEDGDGFRRDEGKALPSI